MARPASPTPRPTTPVVALLALIALLCSTLAIAATPGPVGASGFHGSLVSQTPRADTPKALDGDVWDIAQVGNRIVMGGSFTKVQLPTGQIVDQPYLAAYFLDSGQFDFGFRPYLDRLVESIEPTPSGAYFFAGGAFNNVDGVARAKVAKFAANGDLITSFTANATAVVKDLAVSGTQLYMGGSFRKVNGVTRERLASVNVSTGAVDPNFDFPIETAIGAGGSLSVRALDTTPDGSRLLVAHSGLTVAGTDRVGVALFDISGPIDQLAPWQTNLYRDNYSRCSSGALRLRDAEFSPDGSYFVVVGSGNDRPPVCDTAIKWTTNQGAGAQPEWITRNHDSTYSVGISDAAVYIGGHFCYTEAPGSPEPWPGDTDTIYDCFRNEQVQLGSQVVARNQIAALDVATGKALDWNPGSNAFKGIQAIEVIASGLLIGQDGSRIGGVFTGRSGLLPVAGGGSPTTTTAPTTTSAPTTTTTTSAPGGPDNTPPVVGVTSPSADQVIDGGAATVLSGQATDNAGLARVQLSIRNRATGRWLQPDGSVGNWARIDADNVAAGATTAGWTRSLNIGTGRWTVYVKPIDLAGNAGQTIVVRFVVS